MRGLLASVLSAALAVAWAGPAFADGEEAGEVPLKDGRAFEADPNARIEFRVRWGPRATEFGWGFARVDLQNFDGEARDVRVDLGASGGGDRATRSVRVEARGRARLWMPRLPSDGSRLHVSVAGRPAVELWHSTRSKFDILVVRDWTSPPRFEALIGEALAAPSRIRGASQAFTSHPAEDLPPHWTYLTGAPLIVIDGAARGLDDTARQQTLLDYVEAGGTVLVLRRDALPKGSLADRTAAPGGEGLGSGDLRKGTLGLGRWYATADEDREFSAASGTTFTSSWLDGGGASVVEATERVATIPSSFSIPLRIPGVGRVDSRLFMLLLLAFALLVGPVAYLVLKRRRRLTAMLAVVPAVGAVFTVGILGYGLLSEGLGTRGAVDSVTILDQRDHVATCLAGRTLFAGWGPSALRISPGTVLSTPYDHASEYGFSGRGRGGAERQSMVLDADTSSLDGSILPSRTVTTFSTVSRARARERLRFHRRPDGGYDVLSAEGFAARAESDSILLRDAAGGHFLGDATGTRLRRIDAAEAATALARFAAAISSVERAREEEDPSRREWAEIVYATAFGGGIGELHDREIWARRALPSHLAEGSYVAWTTRAPGFDDLGLEVEWKLKRHLVFGRLAPEDVDE